MAGLRPQLVAACLMPAPPTVRLCSPLCPLVTPFLSPQPGAQAGGEVCAVSWCPPYVELKPSRLPLHVGTLPWAGSEHQGITAHPQLIQGQPGAAGHTERVQRVGGED